MDIEALRSFVAFVETGSFTRTAKQVHRTQSAISMQMRKLEEQVGRPLFTKSGRNLTLSYDGQRLAPYAKHLLALHDNALAQLRSDAPTTIIRLGCPDDYAESILPQFIPLLHQQWHALDLQITTAPSHRIRIMLDSGHLDAGLVTRAPISEEGYLLQTDQGVWACNPHYDLLAEDPLPVALFQNDCKFRQSAIDGLLKQNRNFKVIASSSSASAQRGLIAGGLAIGAMARSSLNHTTVQEIPETTLPQLPAIEVVLVLSGRAENPISETIARQLCTQYQSAIQCQNESTGKTESSGITKGIWEKQPA